MKMNSNENGKTQSTKMEMKGDLLLSGHYLLRPTSDFSHFPDGTLPMISSACINPHAPAYALTA